jgi:hypothetical protein
MDGHYRNINTIAAAAAAAAAAVRRKDRNIHRTYASTVDKDDNSVSSAKRTHFMFQESRIQRAFMSAFVTVDFAMDFILSFFLSDTCFNLFAVCSIHRDCASVVNVWRSDSPKAKT